MRNIFLEILMILIFILGTHLGAGEKLPAAADNQWDGKNYLNISGGNGLTGHYYQNYKIDSTGTIIFTGLTEAFTRVDTVIDFWNGSQYFQWQPVAGWGDHYSVNWTGYIYIEEPGDYGFGTISDDGSQIFIDSVMIVDNSELQWFDWEDNISEGNTSGETFPLLSLDSGFHAIFVRFYENASYDGIKLWWLMAGADTSIIPYTGTNFHGIPPTFNAQTNWAIVPKQVLYTEIDTLTVIDFSGDFKSFPQHLQLMQNYPNPFNSQTQLEFYLDRPSPVIITVYNIRGVQVGILFSGNLSQGLHRYIWDAGNLASGVYFYRLDGGGFYHVKKALLIK